MQGSRGEREAKERGPRLGLGVSGRLFSRSTPVLPEFQTDFGAKLAFSLFSPSWDPEIVTEEKIISK